MKKALMAGVVVAALTLTGCAQAEEPAVEETEEVAVEETTPEPMEEEMVEEGPGTIVDVAVGAGTFTTLVAAVQAAGLVETLSGEGPFTVFAPTDEAFAALPEGVLDALLLEENKELLARILTYHVVSGAVFSADVTTGDVASVEGSTIAVEATDAGVTVNGANVTAVDIEASNGVIHVIDQVILPADVDVAALVG
jgi:uncharacterized surface protein with fasciclin (FAS1) repeats